MEELYIILYPDGTYEEAFHSFVVGRIEQHYKDTCDKYGLCGTYKSPYLVRTMKISDIKKVNTIDASNWERTNSNIERK